MLTITYKSCPKGFLYKWKRCHMEFSRQEYWSGSYSLLQGIFPTQRSNPGLPRCRQILYHVSHQGSPRILEWVTYPFSRGSSQPRNLTGVSYIAGRFFTSWATREQVGIQPTSVPVCLNSQSSLFLIHALIQQVFTEHLLCVKGLFLELGR